MWRANAPGGAPAALKFVNISGAQGLKEYRAVERIKAIRHANLLPIHAFWLLNAEGSVLDETALEHLSGGVKPVADSLISAPGRPAMLVMAMPLGTRTFRSAWPNAAQLGSTAFHPSNCSIIWTMLPGRSTT